MINIYIDYLINRTIKYMGTDQETHVIIKQMTILKKILDFLGMI